MRVLSSHAERPSSRLQIMSMTFIHSPVAVRRVVVAVAECSSAAAAVEASEGL